MTMHTILRIAREEWRYWLRSHLALGATGLFLVLFVAISLLANARMDAERHERIDHQSEAEEIFLAQPDRHPHRMVHYGHYLFRAPVPLAVFDPGLDAVTGRSIFLEGHHQNTVMFSQSAASADFGGLSWLNPALIYQLFAPLIIVILGHSAIVRERESRVLVPLLAMGVSSRCLIAGKALALLSFAVILLIPLLFTGAMALPGGGAALSLLSLFITYFIYLAIWVTITLLVSVSVTRRATALAALSGVWLLCSLALPSIAVNVVSNAEPVVGKIESDLAMLASLRKLGDGHNANDPAFRKLRNDLLEKYQVERIEDLPVNYRGVVATEAEAKLTKVMNEFADERMAMEKRQQDSLSRFGLLTPALAISFASRSIAGSDLTHYHRFQKEAEAVRFSFVQGLNRAHVEDLSYEDDINRNKDEASWERARVEASNWQVLDTFQFKPDGLSERLANASQSVVYLLVWFGLTVGVLCWRAGTLRPWAE